MPLFLLYKLKKYLFYLKKYVKSSFVVAIAAMVLTTI